VSSFDSECALIGEPLPGGDVRAQAGTLAAAEADFDALSEIPEHQPHNASQDPDGAVFRVPMVASPVCAMQTESHKPSRP